MEAPADESCGRGLRVWRSAGTTVHGEHGSVGRRGKPTGSNEYDRVPAAARFLRGLLDACRRGRENWVAEGCRERFGACGADARH
eukprot:4445811-Prymnesium_polylepis.1